MKRTVYSHALLETVESKVPRPIIDRMNAHGWNVFGIYELVKREIQTEKMVAKRASENRQAEPSTEPRKEFWCGVCNTKMVEVESGKWQHDNVGCLAENRQAEPKVEPSTGPGTFEEIFGAGRSSGGLGDYK